MSAQQNPYKQLLICLLFSILYVLFYGYQFNCGDQAEHLPQVYQKLNAALYPGDFFMEYYNQTFTVRHFFVWFVTPLSGLTGVESACWIVFALCLTGCNYFYFKIVLHFLGNEHVAFFAVALCLFVIRNFTIGGNHMQDPMLTGSSLAECLGMAALFFSLKEKKAHAGLLCGSATLFQPLIGLQMAFLIGVKFLSGKPLLLGRFLTFSVYYLPVSFLILLPVLAHQFSYASAHETTELANQILFQYRGHLHYLPQLFPFKDYFLFSILVFVGIMAYLTTSFNDKHILKTIGLSIIITCILFAVILWVDQQNGIGKLQWFKTTVWLNALLAVPISCYVMKKNWIRITSISVLVLALFAGFFNSYSEKEERFYFLGNKTLREAHHWIRNHTETTALILSSPFDDSFACEAKRSQPVNYKAIIHEPAFLLDWKQRMQKYYQLDFTQVTNGNCAYLANIGLGKTDFTQCPFPELDYVLLPKKLRANKTLYQSSQIAFENDDYLVLKLKP